MNSDNNLEELDGSLDDLHVVTDGQEGVAAVVRARGREAALERAREESGRWTYDGQLSSYLQQISDGSDFVEFL